MDSIEAAPITPGSMMSGTLKRDSSLVPGVADHLIWSQSAKDNPAALTMGSIRAAPFTHGSMMSGTLTSGRNGLAGMRSSLSWSECGS